MYFFILEWLWCCTVEGDVGLGWVVRGVVLGSVKGKILYFKSCLVKFVNSNLGGVARWVL